jgi:hypothetical protein
MKRLLCFIALGPLRAIRLPGGHFSKPGEVSLIGNDPRKGGT